MGTLQGEKKGLLVTVDCARAQKNAAHAFYLSRVAQKIYLRVDISVGYCQKPVNEKHITNLILERGQMRVKCLYCLVKALKNKNIIVFPMFLSFT